MSTLIIAEVTVPNISPIIKMDMVFRTLLAVTKTAIKTNAAPKLDAIAKPQLEKAMVAKTPPKIPDPKINKATPKLAPEEIPNTKGPARGFLNKVCINKPLIANPDPTKIAVIAFGNLKCRMINSQLDLELFPPSKMSMISENGIETDPKLILISSNKTNTKESAINCFVYDFCRINL